MIRNFDSSDVERDLWQAVILQALRDLGRAHPTGRRSQDRAEAESFFFSAGKWTEARRAVAEMAGYHEDDLVRAARTVRARRLHIEATVSRDIEVSPDQIIAGELPALTRTEAHP